jgi:hypothetical protein
MSYSETRPWAKAIKEAVITKKMPPWFAGPNVGHFKNERKLTPERIKTLVAWADTGATEGDVRTKPAPVVFAEGWTLGKPNMVSRCRSRSKFQLPGSSISPTFS